MRRSSSCTVLGRVFALVIVAAWLCASALAQTLVLSPDVTSSPAHSVINVTATLQGAAGPGVVTFLDDESQIVSLALSRRNTAVLSIASLSVGVHRVSAVYAAQDSSATIASEPVLLTVTALPVSFSAAAGTGTVYAGGSARIDITGLPEDAGGDVTVSEDDVSLARMNVRGSAVRRYEAFGEFDRSARQNHAALVASDLGLSLTDYSVAGASACDVLPLQILGNGVGPRQSASPLYTLVGVSGIDGCEAASMAWLGVPREYKVLPGDPGAAILSGVWLPSGSVYKTLTNNGGKGDVRFTVTSSGGPVYLWYLVGDHLDGSFTLALDGVPAGVSYTSRAAASIGSELNAEGVGFRLVRLPVEPGRHSLDLNVVSGTVGVLGVATPPARGKVSVHPTVLVAGYSESVRADAETLRRDGLDLRFVNAPSAMNGQGALAAAFEEALGDLGRVPLHVAAATGLSASISLERPGKHAVEVSYSGDATYAAASRSISFDAVPRTETVTSISANATSFFAGTAIHLAASIFPASATGTISLWDGTRYVATAQVVAGGAAFAVSSLAVGIHSLTAVYSGDGADADSQSPALALEITPAPSTLVVAPLPGSVLYGVPLSLAASILPESATGSVSFSDTFIRAGESASSMQMLGQAALGGGTAVLDLPVLAPGSHTFTAAYPGDVNNLSAVSTGVSTIVRTTPTSTILAPIADFTVGTAQTLTAAIAPSSGTGVVTFRDTLSGVLGNAPLVNGSASLMLPLLSPGTHTFTAAYSGDAAHDASESAAETVQIRQISSTTTIAPLSGTHLAGASVSITANVSPTSATGTVLFRDRNAGILGQVALSGGSASLLLKTLAAGRYEIEAIYSGDTNTAASASAEVYLQVVLTPTATALAPTASSIPFSNPLTLTATVAPAPASGSVTFMDGSHVIGSAAMLNGVGTLSISTLAVGPHVLQANFSGGSISAASTSSSVAIDIVPDTTSTTVSLAQSSVPGGGPVVVNVRVSNLYSAVPTGLVTIRSNGSIVGSSTLSNGAPGVAYATITASASTLGTFAVTAFYAGDADDLPSDSSASSITYQVIARPTVGSVSLSAAQVPPQTAVTVVASFASAGEIPAGSVTFLNGGHVIATVPLDAYGQASATLPPQIIGSYAITAAYSPTGIFAASVAPAQTLSVTPPLVASLSPATLNVARASAGTASLVLTPLSGFKGPVSTACVSPGPFIKCTVDSAVVLGVSPLTTAVHIAVAKNMLVAGATSLRTGRLVATLAMFLPLAFIGSRRRQMGRTLLAALLLVSLTGCAEGGSFGEIFPGVQTVHIQVTAAGITSVVDLSVNIQ
jgi:hypothetical protein